MAGPPPEKMPHHFANLGVSRHSGAIPWKDSEHFFVRSTNFSFFFSFLFNSCGQYVKAYPSEKKSRHLFYLCIFRHSGAPTPQSLANLFFSPNNLAFFDTASQRRGGGSATPLPKIYLVSSVSRRFSAFWSYPENTANLLFFLVDLASPCEGQWSENKEILNQCTHAILSFLSPMH